MFFKCIYYINIKMLQSPSRPIRSFGPSGADIAHTSANRARSNQAELQTIAAQTCPVEQPAQHQQPSIREEELKRDLFLKHNQTHDLYFAIIYMIYIYMIYIIVVFFIFLNNLSFLIRIILLFFCKI